MAGETMAGETMAGETMAGETMAGETMGGQMLIDNDGDGFSPPEDCDDDQNSVSPEAQEVCDGIDNDCDTQVDEGLLNACGECGPTPMEICDGIDNDCDTQVDEGLLNACGECGPTPMEICDGIDNDCDNQVDEGLLNACGECGPLPVDVCDDIDNDCDGRVDENLALNACGECGPLPNESCDGLDNDCDTQVDEGLSNPCFTLQETITTENSIIDLGSAITIVGDLNNDGVEDAIVKAQRLDRTRLIAYSGLGDQLWAVEGLDGFATAITSGYYFNDSDLYVAINDPSNERVIIYNNLGQPYIFVSGLDGTVTSMATLSSNIRDTLVIGMPDVGSRGLIQRIRFNPDNPTVTGTVYSTYGQRNQSIGERIYSIGDLVGNSVEDLIITVMTSINRNEDRRTMLMDGSEGVVIMGTQIDFSGQDSNSSFAEDLCFGKFTQLYSGTFAFGSPLATNGVSDDIGAVYLLNGGSSGYFPGMTLYGAQADDQFGLNVETLPRPSAATDVLVIGGNGSLDYINFANSRQGSAVPLPMNNLDIGYGLAIAKQPSADGTYQMWVSGLSDQNDASQVWILKAR